VSDRSLYSVISRPISIEEGMRRHRAVMCQDLGALKQHGTYERVMNLMEVRYLRLLKLDLHTAVTSQVSGLLASNGR